MSVSNLTDAELIELYTKKGNTAAFGELYERYVEDVYRFAYSRLGDKDVVEDIVSETFYTLLDVLENFNYKSKLKTFIFGIAFNKMRQLWQEKKNDKVVGTILDDNVVSIDSFTEEDTEDSEELQWCKKNLPEVFSQLTGQEQAVLEARFLNARSIKETAKLLHLTQSNVRVIQHRAIKKAKKIANNMLPT